VNRQAKQVSKSRELLLDDEDFAAFMMRRTLTQFKDRNDGSLEIARIYSFAFGDSEADSGSQVMAGQLEFSSAVAVHKMHGATGFGLPAAFNLTKTADVTNGINVRNSARPAEILTGSGGTAFQSLSRRSAKTHRPQDVEFVSDHIGRLTDSVILPLFDGLRPFAAHNQAMRELLAALDDSTARADSVQSKVRALLFDGTTNRHVFVEHIDRLKERAKDLVDTAQPVPAHLTVQLTYCGAVSRALLEREEAVKLRRAYILFNIDAVGFGAREKSIVDPELKIIKERGQSIFDTMATQAFQIGYLMAVLTQVEIILPPAADYALRAATTKFVSSLFLGALNSLFSTTQTKHRTLSGYVTEPRASAFDSEMPGFRGLLAATNVRELNERQWEFFRYLVFEVVHSRMASSSVLAVLNAPENASLAAAFRTALPSVLNDVETLRTRYFDLAFRTAANMPDYKRELDMLEMRAKTDGKSDSDVKLLIEEELTKKRASVIEICRNHFRASLNPTESQNAQTV
jgi:hypothetical protein